ncbi:MAG: hypothetical protein JSW52_10125 [Candidatus Coatesbacteria bacterium]|nr:MAG: hypothetical protein JSW52_10125 [Candidatus Coatesbacteria bacterium]
MSGVTTKSKEKFKEKPKTDVSRTTVLRGICITCNYAADCAHLKRNPNVSIWHCENYDDHVEPGETVPEISIPVVNNDVVLGVETEKTAVEIKGLCIDCENRDGCAHAMKTGGVWHCEEYL